MHRAGTIEAATMAAGDGVGQTGRTNEQNVRDQREATPMPTDSSRNDDTDAEKRRTEMAAEQTEDGPDAQPEDNRLTSKERPKCTEMAKVAGVAEWYLNRGGRTGRARQTRETGQRPRQRRKRRQ